MDLPEDGKMKMKTCHLIGRTLQREREREIYIYIFL